MRIDLIAGQGSEGPLARIVGPFVDGWVSCFLCISSVFILIPSWDDFDGSQRLCRWFNSIMKLTGNLHFPFGECGCRSFPVGELPAFRFEKLPEQIDKRTSERTSCIRTRCNSTGECVQMSCIRVEGLNDTWFSDGFGAVGAFTSAPKRLWVSRQSQT